MRRVPMETFFYEAFNEEHVRLVDLNETPIERIEEGGLKTSEEQFQFDILIYATDFSPSKFDACHMRKCENNR